MRGKAKEMISFLLVLGTIFTLALSKSMHLNICILGGTILLQSVKYRAEEEDGTCFWISWEQLLISHHKTAEPCQDPFTAPHPGLHTPPSSAAANLPQYTQIQILTFH